MIIYLVGLSCVGKTTVGKMLAEELGFSFFDLDKEVENYYGESIERLQRRFGMRKFREKAARVLEKLFSRQENSVISGPPSGLKFAYLRVYKRYENPNLISVYLHDSFENIVNRLTFYDIDSNPLEIHLDDAMKKQYIRELKKDYNYFKKSYSRADFKINIENVPLEDIPKKIINETGLKNFIR